MLEDENSTKRTESKPINNTLLYVSLVLVVLLIFAWGIAVIGHTRLEQILFADSSTKELLENFSNFGASYGAMAALFAGIAAILLAFNLRLQQHELAEMRKEMDQDRSLQEFVFLVREFDTAKQLATHLKTGFALMSRGDASREEKTVTGHRYIFDKAIQYLEKRRGGDYFPPDDLESFRTAYRASHDDNIYRPYDPLTPFFTCAKQLAKFLSGKAPAERARFLPLFDSSATVFDLVVLHEHILLSGDKEFQRYAERCGLFSRLRADFSKELDGGPRVGKSAYSADSDTKAS